MVLCSLFYLVIRFAVLTVNVFNYLYSDIWLLDKSVNCNFKMNFVFCVENDSAFVSLRQDEIDTRKADDDDKHDADKLRQ